MSALVLPRGAVVIETRHAAWISFVGAELVHKFRTLGGEPPGLREFIEDMTVIARVNRLDMAAVPIEASDSDPGSGRVPVFAHSAPAVESYELSAAEAARRLGITPRRVTAMCGTGELRGQQHGGAGNWWRVSETSVREELERRKQRTESKETA